MKNFGKNNLIVGILLFVLTFSAVFYFSVEDSFKKAEEAVLSDILNWNYQISRSFAYREHPEIVENVAEGLKVRTQLQSFEFTVAGEVKYSWPGDALAIMGGANCHLVSQALSLDGGARIGFFRGCLPKREIYLKTLVSPLLLGLCLVFGVMLLLSNLLPLSMYRNVLLKFVDSLTAWASQNGQGDLIKVAGDDELTEKLSNLVEEGVKSKVELERAQAEIDAQKIFTDAADQAVHDVRNPMTNLRQYMKNRDDFSDEHYQVVSDTLKRLKAIVGDLGKKRIFEQPPKFVKVWDVAERICARKRIFLPEVEFTIDGDKSLLGFCVEQTLERVLFNIINNSIEAMDKQSGSIKILIGKTKCGNTEVSILDSGQGVPESEIDLLFAKNYTSGKVEGTGLGLHYVSKKMREWGGNVVAKSKLGVGTTMILQFQSQKIQETEEQRVAEAR